MTKEAYDRAKLLFVRMDAYTSKLTDIAMMIHDCSDTAYEGDCVNVQIYNGKGKAHSAYIDKLLVKNMLIGAREHYKSLIEICTSELEEL